MKLPSPGEIRIAVGLNIIAIEHDRASEAKSVWPVIAMHV
jgi:hypothetical protein